MKHDTLTGLAGHVELTAASEAAIQEGRTIALVLLDVDYFAEINTRYGPEAGNLVLQGLAALLKEEGGDNTFRVSGDEFALLFPGESLEQAFLSAEKLRARVEASGPKMNLPAGWKLTITAGVAQFPRDAKNAPGLFHAAAAALMAAKEQGRNTVALPPNEEMVMKSCYYPASLTRQLKTLAEKQKIKESVLLREGLSDLLRKYDKAAA